MFKNKNNKVSLCKITAVIILLMLVVSMLPLLYISRYNFPSADDFANAYAAKQLMQEGHHVFATPFLQVINFYKNWQGTFLALFLSFLNPALLDYRVYKFIAVIIYAIFIFSSMFFAKSLVRVIDKNDKEKYILLGLCVLYISIQQAPSPNQGFYQWTAAAVYTLCYCLQLVFLSFFIKMLSNKPHQKEKLYSIILFCTSAFILGGANYMTALLNTGFILMALLYNCYKKSLKLTATVPIFIFSVLGLMANVFAPGNINRIGAENENLFAKSGIVTMIFECFMQAFEQLYKSIHITVIALVIVLVPVLYKLAQKVDFNFKFPIFVSVFSVCVYSAQFAPLVFTATYNQGRIKNVMFFVFIWLLIINVFYWLGYLQKNVNIFKPQNINSKMVNVGIKIIIISCIVGCLAMPSSYIATKGLKDKTTQEWGIHMASLINQCLDPNVKVPTVTRFLNKPLHLAFYVPEPEANDWAVKAMENFYNKKIIILDEK